MRKRAVFYFLANIIPVFLLLILLRFSWPAVGLMTLGVIFSCTFWHELGGDLSDLTPVWAIISLALLFFGSLLIWNEWIERINPNPLDADIIKGALFFICIGIGCVGIFVGGLFSAERIEKSHEKKIKPSSVT